MPTNSSTNEGLLDPHHSSNKSSSPSYMYCYTSGPSSILYLSFLITYICLLLPLCISILYRQQKGSSSSAAATSHFDCVMYHMVINELIGVFGCAFIFCGIYRFNVDVLTVGDLAFSLSWFGENCFHLLTCLERYTAVVHPIAYMKLRSERGVRIRIITTGCVWLFCFTSTLTVALKMFFILDICLLVLSVTVASFCSVSVLWVLIHSGPQEKANGRERIDQSKQNAFNTILIILAVLVVRFVFNMIWEFVYLSKGIEGCLILSCCTWFNLPSSLVLPLLFLHRTGKIACVKSARKEEWGLNLQKYNS